MAAVSTVIRPGDLLVASTKTPRTGYFHWIIFLSTGNAEGYKFHATNHMNETDWEYECAQGLDWNTVVSVTPIGRLDDWDPSVPSQEYVDRLDGILSKVPLIVSGDDLHDFADVGFTCRAWFRSAVRALHAFRIVNCPDVLDLEKHVVNYASARQFQIIAFNGNPDYAASLFNKPYHHVPVEQVEAEDEILMPC